MDSQPNADPRSYKFPTVQCHKCRWNGRRDAEAASRCAECSRRHIARDRFGASNLDFSTNGVDKVSLDAASPEAAFALADPLKFREMREGTGRRIADFSDAIADRIVQIVRDTRSVDDGELPRVVRESARRVIDELNAETEERLLATLREMQDMNETTLRAIYWMMRGCNATIAAEMIGVSKQAVSKSLLPFLENHPAWAALTGNKVSRWRMKMHGAVD